MVMVRIANLTVRVSLTKTLISTQQVMLLISRQTHKHSGKSEVPRESFLKALWYFGFEPQLLLLVLPRSAENNSNQSDIHLCK